MATPGVEVMNLTFASDDVVWISWNYGAEEDVPSVRHTNDVVGVYVTAGARIHLHRYLDGLRVTSMYCDTDCVIYIQPKGVGTPRFVTGDKLGDTTSDLRPSETISEFVSGEPKNYEYRVLNGDDREKNVFELRGLTLNYNASERVNFYVIRDMILRGNKTDERSVIKYIERIKLSVGGQDVQPQRLSPHFRV